MYNKKLFRNLNLAKYANCVFVVSGLFCFFSSFFLTVSIWAQDAAQHSSASAKLDQTVRLILQNSIRTIQNAQNYSTYIHCQAEIMGKIFNGKGEFYQKRQLSPSKRQETLSARWEMEFYLPHSQFYQLSVLNGDLERLWTLTERRNEEQKNSSERFSEIQVVNLATVQSITSRSPLNYPAITAPWYTQPNVANILEGILRTFQFTMAGETQYPGTNQTIYQIQGQLKPEFVEEVLEAHGLNPASGIFALPVEVPMGVELLIDKARGLPLQVRFYRASTSKKMVPEEAFSYTILFEQSHLNNVSVDDSFFEVSSGHETHDVTEQYLNEYRTQEANQANETD